MHNARNVMYKVISVDGYSDQGHFETIFGKCVCERERKRERAREIVREREGRGRQS